MSEKLKCMSEMLIFCVTSCLIIKEEGSNCINQSLSYTAYGNAYHIGIHYLQHWLQCWSVGYLS